MQTAEFGEILSKSTINTTEGYQRNCSYVFIVSFKQVSHITLVFSRRKTSSKISKDRTFEMTGNKSVKKTEL